MSFSNVENTLRILLKHSKFCSFIKTISLKQKQHVLRTFQFWPKSLYPDLTGVAILLVDFFGWFFEMLKIPFEFFWNIQNFVLSSKQSVWSKNSMFCGLFNFDQNRCIRTLPAWHFVGWFFWLIFLVEFLKCWKYPSNSSETFKILFFHQNNQFEAKTACFADFSILTKIAVSGPYRRGHFVRLIFLVEFFKCWKYPSNSSETFKILFFHQNNQFEAKTACFADFSILTKIAVSGPYRQMLKIPLAILFSWFFWLSFWLKCWKYPSNSSETFKILFFHQNNQFEAKTACFADFSILTKIAVSGPYRRGHFVSWFFWLIFLSFFKCWKYPSNSSETFKILFFHQNNQFEAKTACFADFSILTKIAVSGPYRRGHFVGWFFWLSFSNVENTLRILLKHSKFCSFIKTISLKQKQHVLRTFQFWPKSLYPDLTGVANFVGWFFWLSFSNVENTLRILLKHSKFCSFIKTISLKQKQHVLRTFQIWPKSLYPDLTGVAILLVDFFLLSFSNVENTLRILLKHSKFCSFIKTISLKQKQHVLRTFQFWPKSLYPDLTGVAILLVDFFVWVFQMLKIPFEFFWNIQNFVLSSKQSVWGKNSMFCGLFNFDQNRCIRTLPAWPFC